MVVKIGGDHDLGDVLTQQVPRESLVWHFGTLGCRAVPRDTRPSEVGFMCVWRHIHMPMYVLQLRYRHVALCGHTGDVKQRNRDIHRCSGSRAHRLAKRTKNCLCGGGVRFWPCFASEIVAHARLRSRLSPSSGAVVVEPAVGKTTPLCVPSFSAGGCVIETLRRHACAPPLIGSVRPSDSCSWLSPLSLLSDAMLSEELMRRRKVR